MDRAKQAEVRDDESRRAIAKSLSGVYVIVGPGLTRGRSIEEVAIAALEGGACAIQLRDKHSPADSIRHAADCLRRLCSDAGSLLIINDDPTLARACAADGVHVGQTDASIPHCRTVLGGRQIVGKSNANETEAQRSVFEGADYIAVGSIFATQTKLDSRPAGLDVLRRVAGDAAAPVVAIGGINADNVGAVAAAGADAVCVASAVGEAYDPEGATRRLIMKFQSAKV